MDATIPKTLQTSEHKRVIETLGRLDQLLTQTEGMVLASRSHSPFNDYLTRLSEDEDRAVATAIAAIRTVMLCTVRQVADGQPPEPHVHLTWALRTTLASALRLLEELPTTNHNIAEVCLQVAGRDGAVLHTDPIARMRQILADLDARLSGEK